MSRIGGTTPRHEVPRGGSLISPRPGRRTGRTRTQILLTVLIAAAVLVGCRSTPAADPSTVAVIGDSNTARAGSKVNTALAGVGFTDARMYVYGCGGKTMVDEDACGKTTAQNVRDARTRLRAVSTWVIALATNDLGEPDDAFADRIRQVMAMIGSDDKVIWVNVTFWNPANDNAAHYNPIIAKTLREFPNAVYADWQGYVHAPTNEVQALWLKSTGVDDVTHMTDAGYVARSTWYAAQVVR